MGAVLVKDGRILKSASNNVLKNIHAEERVFNNLSCEDFKDAVLYLTLPPCVDRMGRKSCAQLIVDFPIKKVVCLLDQDYNPRIGRRGLAELKRHGIKVEVIHAPLLKFIYLLINLPAIVFFTVRSFLSRLRR